MYRYFFFCYTTPIYFSQSVGNIYKYKIVISNTHTLVFEKPKKR